MARKNENQIAHDDKDKGLLDPAGIPIELFQDLEKQLQAKMRAMLEAGVPVLVAAATANHIVQDLLMEALGPRSSGGDAPTH